MGLFAQPGDDELDHRPMGKGKHRNITANECADRDPEYLVWAYETWADKPCSQLLYEATRADALERRRQSRVARDQAHE